MSSHRPNLWRVLFEASRIISPLQFIPNIADSFSTFRRRTPKSPYWKIATPDPSSLRPFFLLFFSLCANSSITYSTFRGFYGRPVRFISSLKSILVSFFPLLATVLVTQIILGFIVFAFVILMVLAYNGLALLGIEMDYDTEYFLVFVILIAALLVGLLIYLQVEWYLTAAVVVLESQWGFAPLKRSWYLVKGMRGVFVI